MQTAIIDFLGVTFWMDAGNARASVEVLLKGWFGVECRVSDTGKGWNGYAHRMDIDGIGLVAWGGNGDTIHIEVSGGGCKQVKDWQAVADSLAMLYARVTRLDIAVDDYTGTTYNLDWCRSQYESGGFDPKRGSKPTASLWSDEGSGKGSTYYVGSRESGKLCRGYEKGKQLGDPASPWFRVEVEWRNRKREIPLDAIRNPGAYFAGAYPCLAGHATEQRQIVTVAHEAAATIEKSIEHARKQAGRVVHALLALGHEAHEVLARLHVPELPKRLTAPIRAFLALDESERTYTTATAPAWAKRATPDEVEGLYKAFTLQRGPWRVGQGTNGQRPAQVAAPAQWHPLQAA